MARSEPHGQKRKRSQERSSAPKKTAATGDTTKPTSKPKKSVGFDNSPDIMLKRSDTESKRKD
jgi:hypothetical protein